MSIESIIEEQKLRNPTKIKVIGVGGGGCNAIDRMIDSGMKGVEFICINTDLQPLQTSKADVVLQIGEKTTGGLGTGYNPEVGKISAEEQSEQITEVLKGANMVFLTAGMGGGTGTGASPIIADLAKKLNILVVAVVTIPFHFEGKKRMSVAKEGVARLAERVDTIITISNENLLTINQDNFSIRDAFFYGDSVLMNGVKGISDLVLNHSPGSINVDFADLKTIMSNQGMAVMSMTTVSEENSIAEIVKKVIFNPLVEHGNIRGAKGLLVNLTHGKGTALKKAVEIIDGITREVDEDAVCIHGFLFDEDIGSDIKITVIATGFDEQRLKEESIKQSNRAESGAESARANFSQSLEQEIANPFASRDSRETNEGRDRLGDTLGDPLADISQDPRPSFLRTGNDQSNSREAYKEHVFSTDPVLRQRKSTERNSIDKANEEVAFEEFNLTIPNHYPKEMDLNDLEIPAFLRKNKNLNL